MGFSDLPEETDVKKILAACDMIAERLDNFAEAINGLGMNVEWIIDRSKGIFQMFSDPRFMSALPSMMNPAGVMQAAEKMGVSNGGSDGSADAGPAAAE